MFLGREGTGAGVGMAKQLGTLCGIAEEPVPDERCPRTPMHITAAITSPPLIYLTHHIASRIYRHRHRAIDAPRISRMNRGLLVQGNHLHWLLFITTLLFMRSASFDVTFLAHVFEVFACEHLLDVISQNLREFGTIRPLQLSMMSSH